MKRYGILTAVLVAAACCAPAGAEYTITTIAGTGLAGFSGDGGNAVSAQLNYPWAVSVDSMGAVYVADINNNRIRRINASGVIATIAGDGTAGFGGDSGLATSAQLYNPRDAVADAAGNVYIADGANHRIRKINASGVISTYAGTGVAGDSGDGGAATSAWLHTPSSIALDAQGNLYVADEAVHKVRKINVSGVITTVAGTGTAGYWGDGGSAASALLRNPCGVTVDSAGNIYVCDTNNHRVRRINSSGVITTVAGTGTAGYSGDGGLATSAQLNMPVAVAVDSLNNVYISVASNSTIRKIDASGIITTFAGTGVSGYSGDGGDAATARINAPRGIAVDASGSLYIPDSVNQRIRKCYASGGSSTADFTWSGRVGVRTTREKLAAVFFNNKVYAFGGIDGLAPVRITEAYDPLADEWVLKSQMSVARTGPGAAAVNGKIYVIGGSQGSTYFTTVEAYDPAADSWTTQKPMLTGREGCSVAAVNGKIYAIGGMALNQTLAVVEEYDPSTDTWTTKTSMPTARAYASAGVIGNKIYVAGGIAGSTYLNTLEAYDPVTNSWAAKTPMGTGKCGMAAGAAGEKLYVFGGVTAAGCQTAAEAYDSLSNTWQTKTGLSEARGYGAAAVKDNTFYLAGGRSGTVPNTSVVNFSQPTLKALLNVPVLSWLGEGNYVATGVFPESGLPSTNFVFRLNYAQYNGYAPRAGYPVLRIFKDSAEISGSPFSMEYYGGTMAGNAVYTRSMTLSSGTYAYSFEAFDTKNSKAVGSPVYDLNGGIVVSYDPSSGAGLSNAYCFPVPARLDRGDRVRFSGLTPHAVVTILAPDGHPLKKLYADHTGVIPAWDGRTDNGDLAATGVYTVHAKDDNGNRKIYTIMLVR